MFDTSTILFAFALTFIAGLSTSIGSVISMFFKHTNTKFLSAALGFSAGVMIYVSLVEMLIYSKDMLITEMGVSGYWIALASFFGGVALIGIIDKLVPEAENPHEIHSEHDKHKHKLRRLGLFTALAIAIHNFPEGLATFVSALQSPGLGIAIAIAIAIHNIPEGIAVSVPLYHATGSRKKAFWYSTLSGLAEPLGALIGYIVLMKFLTPLTFGIVFALVAGIMVYISIDELLPAAREYGEHHLSVYGFILGMLVMAISLVLFIP